MAYQFPDDLAREAATPLTLDVKRKILGLNAARLYDLGVRDIHGICRELAAAGARIPRPPGPMKHGTTHIAFVEDPDGYKIELIDLDTRD